jgi:hypothetical protein
MSKNAVASVLVVAIFAPTLLNSAEIGSPAMIWDRVALIPELRIGDLRGAQLNAGIRLQSPRSYPLCDGLCISAEVSSWGGDANRVGAPPFSLYIEGAGSATAGSRVGRRSLFGDDRLGNDAEVDQIAAVEFEGRYGMIFTYELGAGLKFSARPNLSFFASLRSSATTDADGERPALRSHRHLWLGLRYVF